MNYSNNCGGCCEPETYSWSKDDQKAMLKEKEAILEAKLATIRHWIENIDKGEVDKK